MNKIHHNTAKKAVRFGIELVVSDVDGEIRASKDGEILASGMAGNLVLEAALAKLNGSAVPVAKAVKPRKARKVEEDEDLDEGEEEFEEAEEGDEEDEDGEEGASKVKKKYKTRYRPFKATCGDEISKLVANHVKIKGE